MNQKTSHQEFTVKQPLSNWAHFVKHIRTSFGFVVGDLGKDLMGEYIVGVA